MDNDDRLVGRLLDQHELDTLASRVTTTLPTCIASPELTEGPYFVDEGLRRSDIRAEPTDGTMREGAPLELELRIWRVTSDDCTPFKDVQVDIWQCDAFGVYSGVVDPGFDTMGQTFLRGYQVTDGSGLVHFTTIYPGWYDGRSVHIHFKVRGESSSRQGFDFTSQLFFDDAFTDRVYRQQPYASRGERTYRNAQDSIFQRGGERLTLDVSETDTGYRATFDIGVQIE